jgi:hypothetical protein
MKADARYEKDSPAGPAAKLHLPDPITIVPAHGRKWHRAAKVSAAVCPQLVKADSRHRRRICWSIDRTSLSRMVLEKQVAALHAQLACARSFLPGNPGSASVIQQRQIASPFTFENAGGVHTIAAPGRIEPTLFPSCAGLDPRIHLLAKTDLAADARPRGWPSAPNAGRLCSAEKLSRSLRTPRPLV